MPSYLVSQKCTFLFLPFFAPFLEYLRLAWLICPPFLVFITKVSNTSRICTNYKEKWIYFSFLELLFPISTTFAFTESLKKLFASHLYLSSLLPPPISGRGKQLKNGLILLWFPTWNILLCNLFLFPCLPLNLAVSKIGPVCVLYKAAAFLMLLMDVWEWEPAIYLDGSLKLSTPCRLLVWLLSKAQGEDATFFSGPSFKNRNLNFQLWNYNLLDLSVYPTCPPLLIY